MFELKIIGFLCGFQIYVKRFYSHAIRFPSERKEPTSRPASRIILSCYWLLVITIVAVYTGNLIAFMTIKKIKLPVNTLEDLAHHPEFQAGLSAGTSTYDLFKVIILKGVSFENNYLL